MKSLSRVRLFATPWTVAYQASPSMGFSRQEYWSGLPFPSPGDLPDPGIEPRSPTLEADALTSEPPGKPNETETGLYRTVESELSGSLNTSLNYMYLVSQSCLTLCDPMDCSLRGFSIHGILKARIPEWFTISFSRGSSRPRDRTQVSCIAGRHFNL